MTNTHLPSHLCDIFDLKENQLGDEGIEVLTSLLSSGILPYLTYLEVSDTEMRQPGLTAIIRALPRMAEAQLATKHEQDAIIPSLHSTPIAINFSNQEAWQRPSPWNLKVLLPHVSMN